jgi:hypothetical protein
MEEKVIRLRIPEKLYIKYKVICVNKKLSLPKQTAELLRKFVEVYEENEYRTSHIKKD